MFEYGQIIEYIDGTYDENFNNALSWCNENYATLDELVEERKEEEREFEETTIVDGEMVVEKVKRTVLIRYFQINKIEIIVPNVPEPTLDELKQQKHEEINAERDKAEQGGFEYMGKVFDSDQVSCIRMTCAAQSLQAVSLQEGLGDITITWTCQDNSTIDLNAEQLSGLVIALAQWSNKCHQRATELKKQIELAQSKEELEKIVWTLE